MRLSAWVMAYLIAFSNSTAVFASERPQLGGECSGKVKLKIWKIFPGDGVLRGWSFDPRQPHSNMKIYFYIDAPAEEGGVFAGTASANLVDRSVNWTFHVEGNHDFAFPIPVKWWNGARHVVFAQTVAVDGRVCPSAADAKAEFALSPATTRLDTPVTDGRCLDPGSRCEYTPRSAAAESAPALTGWSDSKNYFNEFKCSSPVGFNAIARLNIMPLGKIGPHVQKDSLDYGGQHDGSPIIYFSLGQFDRSSNWSLKKAMFSAAENRWRIYSVLDNPDFSGGVSSENGQGKYIVMNDYSQPGWGPTSPVPGRENKIPAVANVSSNPSMPSYALTGAGSLGITAVTNTVYPGSDGGAGVMRSTCIHMNPKLLDYDANGVPHTLIANLWQNTRSDACPLPPGAPVAKLPYPGNYLYRYKGQELGWQLDLNRGIVTDSIHNETQNSFIMTPKLLAGTAHTLVIASRDGMVYTIDADGPNSDNTEVLADCRKSGVHFSEAAGTGDGVFFLVVKNQIDAERRKYGIASDAYPDDIYYLYRR